MLSYSHKTEKSNHLPANLQERFDRHEKMSLKEIQGAFQKVLYTEGQRPLGADKATARRELTQKRVPMVGKGKSLDMEKGGLL